MNKSFSYFAVWKNKYCIFVRDLYIGIKLLLKMRRLCSCIAVILLLVSCGKGVERDLRDKWKFEKYIITENGVTREQRVDSVFMNFMKGSTSLIFIKEDASYFPIYGDYEIIDEEYLWLRYRTPDEELYGTGPDNDSLFYKYFRWGGETDRNRRTETFRIKKLTSKDLELEKQDTIMVLTKF